MFIKELIPLKTHTFSTTNFKKFAIFFVTVLMSSLSYANPEGGQVAAGSAVISSPNTNTLQVRQSSDKAVIDWRTFNISPNERTQFLQPSSSSITLNRVNPANGVSAILGSLSANGQVWIINPAGIIFGASARVDVGGLLATTANISNLDFMNGNYHFTQSPDWHGAVINEGIITVADRGLAVLVAPGVENRGVIKANLGRVVLAAGNEYTVDFYGDQLINFGVNSQVTQAAVDGNGRVLKNGVSNSGKIIANGGTVLLTANVAKNIVDNSVNMSGYVKATSAVSRNGEIILMGGNQGSVKVSGKLIASGKKSGQTGGTVKISGRTIELTDHAVIDVSGDLGGGNILIGGNAHGAGPLLNADYTYVGSNVVMNASALTTGDGGKVVVWSDLGTQFYGSIFAKGGLLGGNGGFAETSGAYLDIAGIRVNLSSPIGGQTGTWLLDPANLTISAGATANPAPFTTSYTADNNSNTSTVNVTDLTNALDVTSGGANVIIQTTSGGAGAGVGNITVATPVTWTTAHTLTLISINNIIINAASAITTGAVGSSLVLDMAGSAGTQASVIGGAGSLVKQGSGTFTLSQANTYTGGTTINGGTLNASVLLAAGSNVGTGGITINNGSIFSYTGVTATAPAARTFTIGAGGGTIQTTNAAASTLTLTGGISNSGALIFDTAGAGPTNISLSTAGISGGGSVTKTGAGLLTFGFANTYTGATQINNGTLSLTNANGLGSGASQSSSTTIASGATLNTAVNATFGNTNAINVAGTGVGGAGALTSTVSTGVLSNAITLTNNTTIGGVASLTLNGIITGGFGITKIGAGTLTLGGSNGYTGSTTINVGTLTLTNANALGSGATQSSSILVSATGAALNLNFATATLGNTNNITLNGTGVANAGALTGSTTTDTVSNNIILGSNSSIGGASNMMLSGIISDGGSGFNLTKVGAGIITASNANTYSGGTIINTGTLSATNKNALGTTGALAVNNAAILSLNLGGNTLQNSSTLTLSNTAALTSVVGAGLTDVLNNPIVLTGTHTITSTTATAVLSLAGGITNNTNNLTFTGSGNIIESGVIGSSSGGIIKSGTGTLTLSNANTYTGTTAVSAGTLTATNTNALGGAGGGAISVATASTLRFNLSGATLTNPNTITLTGTAALVSDVAGGSTDIINNPITFAAAATPTFTATNATGVFTLGGNITNSTGLLTINGAGDININGVLGASSGGVTKAGAGTLTYNAANTYTGATTISAGTLKLGSANGIGSGSAVNLSIAGAQFNLNNFNDTIGSLTGVAGTTVTLGSGTLTTGGNNTTTTYTGVISGSGGGLTKEGTGVMTLAGANTYTGATQINNGTLTLTNLNALGSGATQSSSTTIASGATLSSAVNATFGNTNTINLAGTGVGGVGALISTVSTGVFSNAITLTNDTTIGGAANLTLNGIISGGFGITKTGAGTLILSGSNGYTGSTTINVGTLTLTNANALGSGATQSSSILVSATGAALNLNFATATLGNTNNITLNGTGVANAGALTGSTTTDTVSNNIILGSNSSIGGASNMMLSGIISDGGSGFNLTKVGAGIITASNANTYSGGTIINTGTLSATNKNALGTTGALAVNNAAILSLNLGGNTLQNSSTLTLSNTAALTSVVGAGLTDVLNNPIVLTGTHTITSTTATAVLSLAGGITNNTNNLTFTGSGNIIESGVIGSSSGGIIKSGTGTLTLSNANTYTGTTAVSAGTLTATNTNALGGAGGGAISVATASTLRFNLSGATLTNPNTITLTGTAALVSDVAGGSTDIINNPITFAAAATPTFTATNATGVFTLGGNITNSTGLLTINGAGDININGVLGASSGGVTKAGAGTLTYNAANTYTGATTISAGTLKLGSANGIGSGSAVNLSIAGAQFNLNNFNDTIGSLTGVAGTTVTLGSGTLTTGGNNTTTTYTGVISGSGGGLTKEGTGVMTLAGANTYTGATQINNGTLTLTNLNALGSGATQSSGTTVTGGAVLNLNFASATLGNTNGITLNGNGIANGGALIASTTTMTVSNAITLGSNTTIGGTNTMVLNGVISDGGNNFSLTKAGANTITLSNANTYGGGTTINAGTLVITNKNALGSIGTIAINNASTLNFNLSGNTLANSSDITMGGTSNLISSVAAASADTLNNAITLAGSTNTITSTTANATLNLGGNIINNTSIVLAFAGAGNTTQIAGANILSGVGGITKAGSGTLTLANANTYSGTTAVTAGALNFNSIANADGTSSALGAPNSIVNGTITLGPATLIYTGNGDVSNRVINLTGAGILTASGAGTLTLNSNGSTNGITGTNQNLTLNGLGLGVINSVIATGGGTVTESGAGTWTLGGANTYTGLTTVSAGTLSITNAAGLGDIAGSTLVTGGTLQISNVTLTNEAIQINNGATITGTGTAAIPGIITLGGTAATRSISAPGVSDVLTLTSTLNGAVALTLGGSGNIILSSALGNITPLASLIVNANLTLNNGNITTTGTQTYNNAVILGANTNLTTTNSLVSFALAASTLSNQSLTPRALTINTGGGGITLIGNIGAGVNGALGDITLNTTGATNITGTVAAASLTTNVGGTTTLNTSNIITSGSQIYNNAVTLGTIAKSLTSSAGAINFNSTLSGAFGLTLSGNMGVQFGGAVTTLTSLDVTGATAVNANITTTGTQTYHSPVTLGANSTFATTNSLVNFVSTIDRDATAARNLTVSSGTGGMTFSDNLGAGVNGALGAIALTSTGATTLSGTVNGASLSVTGVGGSTALNGGTITTSGTQTYNNAVTLGADTTLNTTDSLVSFALAAATVNRDATAARALTINSGLGGITFAGIVGAGVNGPLGAMTLNSSGTTTFAAAVNAANVVTDAGGTTAINGGTITTTDVSGQVYNDAITLNANTTLNANAGLITFNSTLDSLSATARKLTLNSSGATTFGGAVGGVFALSTLITDAVGGTAINGGGITTAGTQTFNDAVSLGQDTTFTVTAAASSVLLPNSLNNFTFTPTFATSGAGTLTTVSLSNASASAVVPVLSSTPTNLTLNFSGSALSLPALTLAGALNVAANGDITQSGALVITGLTTVDAGIHDIVLNNSSNDFSAISVTNGNNVLLKDLDALTINTSTVSGSLTALAGGTITLNGNVSANGIELSAQQFINNAGASALNPGGGRYLIWSVDPANDNRGGLAYDFKQYNATYGVTAVLGTGNGVLYTLAPVISPSLIGSVSKIYNGTTAATLTGSNYTFSGAIDSDTVTLNNPVNGTYGSPDVGTNINVAVSGINIVSATNGSAPVYGYQIIPTANANIGQITQASLSITANDTNKTYGQTVTFNGSEFTPTGLQNGETVGSVSLNSSGAINTASVAGSPYSIVASAATGGTFNAANYSISYVDGVLTVNTAPLSITANNTSKTYGQTVTFNGSEFTPTGLQNGETVGSVSLNSSGAINTASVAGSPYSIVASAATGGTLNAANYSISYVDGVLTVNTAPLSITANNTNKTYGQAVTFNGSEFTPTGLQNGETVGSASLNSSGAINTASVAGSPYSIVASAAMGGTFNAANYNINYVNGVLTVNTAPLSITANNTSKTYGQTVTFNGSEFTPTGLQNGETVGSVSLNSSGAINTASVAGSPYSIVASAATGGTFNAANYSISYADGVLTVNTAPLSITANNTSKIYGQTVTFNGSEFTPTGLQNGETVGSVSLNSSGASNTASAAGSPYSIVASAATGGTFNAANYNISYVDGVLTVNTAPLSITANNTSKTYGQTVTFNGSEFTPTGLQNGETVGSVSLSSSGAINTASVAGSPYSIVVSAATGGTFNAANYSISYADGVLTVNTAPLSITANNTSKTYGQTVTFNGSEFTPTGLQNGETVGSVSLNSSGAINTASVAGSPYSIVASAATGGTFNATNYSISYADGVLTVNTAPLSITANNTSKTYGQTVTFNGSEFTPMGLQNGETVGSVSLNSSGAINTASVAGSPYSIVASAATGGTFNPANYNVAYVNGVLTINPATLTYNANTASMIVNNTVPPLSGTVTGFVNNETQATATTGTLAFLTSATSSSNPGNYAINGSGLTANQGNYLFVQASGNATALTIINSNQMPPISPTPPTSTPISGSFSSIIFSYLYALNNPTVSVPYDISFADSLNYAAIMQKLDSGKVKCISIGAVKICTSEIKSTKVNF
jgi:fibronectin-binding autotransporter adhesin